MVIFGVETVDCVDANKFIIETDKRMEKSDMAKNPFIGYAKVISKDFSGMTSVIKMAPLWPNFGPWIALFSLMPILIFGWFSSPLTLLFPLIFLSIGFFWTETFFYIVFKAGLRKAGYIGPIKKLKKNDLIDELTTRLN